MEALEVKNEFALGLWQKENGPIPQPVNTGVNQSVDLIEIPANSITSGRETTVEISDLNLSLDELICIDSRQLKTLGNVTIA